MSTPKVLLQNGKRQIDPFSRMYTGPLQQSTPCMFECTGGASWPVVAAKKETAVVKELSRAW